MLKFDLTTENHFGEVPVINEATDVATIYVDAINSITVHNNNVKLGFTEIQAQRNSGTVARHVINLAMANQSLRDLQAMLSNIIEKLDEINAQAASGSINGQPN